MVSDSRFEAVYVYCDPASGVVSLVAPGSGSGGSFVFTMPAGEARKIAGLLTEAAEAIDTAFNDGLAKLTGADWDG